MKKTIMAVEWQMEHLSVNDFLHKNSNTFLNRLFYNYTGTLGDVIYNKVDATFNGRFMTKLDSNDIEYLYPVLFDRLCIISPKSMKIPAWMAIFKCFDIYVWCTIIVINTLCGYFWYILKQWQKRYFNHFL